MLKRIIAISFLFIYLAGLVQPVLPLIEYCMFKDSIVELFCINKDNPEMDCDGKCYLADQIEEQQDNSEHPESLINSEDIPVTLYTATKILEIPPPTAFDPSGCYTNSNPTGILSEMLQPPCSGMPFLSA